MAYLIPSREQTLSDPSSSLTAAVEQPALLPTADRAFSSDHLAAAEDQSLTLHNSCALHAILVVTFRYESLFVPFCFPAERLPSITFDTKVVGSPRLHTTSKSLDLT